MADRRVVLITGCSTGIGRSLCLALSNKGFLVYASARNVEAIKDLSALGVRSVALDVCNEDSIKAAVKQVLQEAGRIDMLVNNAGLSQVGPALEIPLMEMRRLFETNVIGLLAVSQAVTAHMVSRRSGVVVNIGSIAGYFGLPWSGGYSASKAAVNRLTDSMRLELEPFNVKVVEVQPGAVISSIADTAGKEIERVKSGLWASYYKGIVTRWRISQTTGMSTDSFAESVSHQLVFACPPRQIVLGPASSFSRFAKNWLPVWVVEWYLRRKFMQQ